MATARNGSPSNVEFSPHVPRAVRAVVISLAALHWRTQGAYVGATYSGLLHLLGNTHKTPLRRAVADGEAQGLLRVIYAKGKAGRNKGMVALTRRGIIAADSLFAVAF